MFTALYIVAGAAANVAEYIGNVLIRSEALCSFSPLAKPHAAECHKSGIAVQCLHACILSSALVCHCFQPLLPHAACHVGTRAVQQVCKLLAGAGGCGHPRALARRCTHCWPAQRSCSPTGSLCGCSGLSSTLWGEPLLGRGKGMLAVDLRQVTRENSSLQAAPPGATWHLAGSLGGHCSESSCK